MLGLIVGSGTGRELADVFTRCVNRIAELIGKKVEVVECGHVFKSYHSLLGLTDARIEEAVREDIVRLGDFYRKLYRSGGRAVFRTAINAETLYRFRGIGKAVKTVYIPLQRKSLLFIRDEAQGFYTNDSWESDGAALRFCGSFSRNDFRDIAGFALGEANRVLRTPYDIWLVYKHHLFANLIESWTQDLFGHAEFFQPNHATDLLFQYLRGDEGRDLLLLMGNEAGDILHEVLIFNLGLGTRNTLHARNVYLHPDLAGLVEYQTVHGSADGIGGQGVVNPLATLRALGAFVEEQLHEAGFSALMEQAIEGAKRSGVVGCDAGGQSSTAQIADAVLAEVESRLRATNQ
jgi:tartrate dehydrogenase/decarboxylase/D-malate dehydrogenase